MLYKYHPSKKILCTGEVSALLTVFMLAIITAGIFVGNSLINKKPKTMQLNAQIAPSATITAPTTGSSINSGIYTIAWGVQGSQFFPDGGLLIVDDLSTSVIPTCDPYNPTPHNPPPVGEACVYLGAAQQFSWSFPASTDGIIGVNYKIQVNLS